MAGIMGIRTIYQEMSRGDGAGRMWSFQRWAKLPAKNKMMDPPYRQVKSGEIPSAALLDGGIAWIIRGETEVVTGPVKGIVIDPFYCDVSIPPKEPVAWCGPIVMNTREELRLAFEEFRNGTFVKKKQ